MTAVLIVVDMQNDFLPGGALAVPDGDAVIAPINALAARFEHVILTRIGTRPAMSRSPPAIPAVLHSNA